MQRGRSIAEGLHELPVVDPLELVDPIAVDAVLAQPELGHGVVELARGKAVTLAGIAVAKAHAAPALALGLRVVAQIEPIPGEALKRAIFGVIHDDVEDHPHSAPVTLLDQASQIQRRAHVEVRREEEASAVAPVDRVRRVLTGQ